MRPPAYRHCQIYTPGDVVRHDGRLWMLAYYRPVTSTLAPGEKPWRPGEELWTPLDADKWRASPVPKVKRKGWRQRQTRRLLAIAEHNRAAYRTLKYDIPLPDGTYGPRMDPRLAAHWNPSEESRLARELEISADDLHAMLMKRRARAMTRFHKREAD